jgi:PKD repeat protein
VTLTVVLVVVAFSVAMGADEPVDLPPWPEPKAADDAVSLLRGPYLQLGTPTSVIVRWRTDVAIGSTVIYGQAVELTGGAPQPPLTDSLTLSVEDTTLRTEHQLTLTGLQANTRYYYAVGHGAGVTFEPLAGYDADHFFDTPPPSGVPKPTRVWVLGDSGSGNQGARDVRDRYYDHTDDVAHGGIGARHTELWLMLGDNAYPQGTDDQYQTNLFEIYDAMLRKSVLWPTIGNHDLYDSAQGTWPYFDAFTLPANGEAGGEPSSTEAYYSFDYANIHFVCLDSATYPIGGLATFEMLTWLEADLLDTTQEWIIAYWHHPPYSKGGHDSDDPADSNGRLVDMRTHVVPILEAHGVDLVLSGHSHSYERSYLIDGHHGDSDTFDPGLHIIDGGDGDVNGDGAYQAEGIGTVFTVAGNASHLTPGQCEVLNGPAGVPPHPAMLTSLYVLGSVVLDVDGNRLDAILLDGTGAIQDSLTLLKGSPPQPPVADFGANPTTALAPASVQFTDLSANRPTVWRWDFDDDGLVDSVEPDPLHEYGAPGHYSVRLAVANSEGADEVQKPFLVCVTAGVPDAITGLILEPDRTTLTWNPDPKATAYDVARGELGGLQATGGDFAAVTECLDNVLVAQTTDPDVPDPGEAFFYLVRGLNCLPETGTYDAATTGSHAPRDLALQGNGVACACPVGDDNDADGYCNAFDNCPDTAGDDLGDQDQDGLGDICDPCPNDAQNDVDGDDVCGDVDNCPLMANPDQVDTDDDGAGNVCDPDDDGDGVPDTEDDDPLDRFVCRDADADGCDDCSSGVDDPSDDGTDLDADGRCDLTDDCVDADGDGLGNGNLNNTSCLDGTTDSDDSDPTVCSDVDADGCDDCSVGPWDPTNDGTDIDSDVVCDAGDNCPGHSNNDQADGDGDDLGDVCDPCTDLDGDGFGNPGFPHNVCPVDNCPSVANPFQGDVDDDGVGDVCDFCMYDPYNDPDFDFICGDVDNCDWLPNPDQADADVDEIGDVCDPCTDMDGDGYGNPGFPANYCATDNCPDTANPDQDDFDGDGLGDACDPDDDNDGAADAIDCEPLSTGVAAPPGPVGDTLRVDKASGISVRWLRAFQGHTTNVYSAVRQTGEAGPMELTCLLPEHPETTADATDPIAVGSIAFYQVAPRNACGEIALDLVTDACETQGNDSDQDGIPDLADNCTLKPNPAQLDADFDFVGDICDNCPQVFNPDQADTDGDTIGDACD